MQEIVQSQNSPTKRGGASFIRIEKDEFILLGGAGREQEFDDFWRLSFVSQNQKIQAVWEKIQLKPSNIYTPRSGQSSCLANGIIYIFGGQNFHLNTQWNDFLSFNPQTSTLTKLEPIEENAPNRRNSCSLTFNSKSNQLVLLGGANQTGPLSDLFLMDLDGQALLWKKCETQGSELFGAREMHTANFYLSKENLFGGVQNKTVVQGVQPKLVNIQLGENNQEAEDLEDEEEQKNLQMEGIQFISSSSVNNNNKIEIKQNEKGKMVEMKLPKVDIQFDEQTAVRDDMDSVDDGFDENLNQEEEKYILQQKDDVLNEFYQYLIVVGGRQADKMCSDILVLDLKSNEWKKLKDLPHGICSHATEIVNDQLYIYGGTDGQQFLDCIYRFNLKDGQLQEVIIKKKEIKKYKFEPRIASNLGFLEEQQQLIIFGGSGYQDEISQMLSINLDSLNLGERVKNI